VVFPVGIALAMLEMRHPELARGAPIAAGLVVLVAGLLQFTSWKARRLACCRQDPDPGQRLPSDAGTAWRLGLRLGLHCCCCCAGPMAVLLVLGLMDLGAMVVVTAAITAERLLPEGERAAGSLGVIAVVAGLLLIVRAVGPA
jgi:predicted metal-binding membrane protein